MKVDVTPSSFCPVSPAYRRIFERNEHSMSVYVLRPWLLSFDFFIG